MQASTRTLSSPALRVPARTPRDSSPALHVALSALWGYVRAFGQRRAAAEILELANALQATRPATAAQMRRAVARSWD